VLLNTISIASAKKPASKLNSVNKLDFNLRTLSSDMRRKDNSFFFSLINSKFPQLIFEKNSKYRLNHEYQFSLQVFYQKSRAMYLSYDLINQVRLNILKHHEQLI